MRRQTRRAVVGALLALVGFAPPAEAACAWVLWQHITEYDKDLQSNIVWARQVAFDRSAECRAAAIRLAESHGKIVGPDRSGNSKTTTAPTLWNRTWTHDDRKTTSTTFE